MRHRSHFVASLLLIQWVAVGSAAAAEAAASGRVLDAISGRPLPGASIEIVGGSWATVADDEGQFVVPADLLPALLRISHVGYASFEALLDSAGTQIALAPAPLRMREVTIDGRDPAYDIMRRVAARRLAQDSLYSSWRTEVYARQTLFAGTKPIAIRQGASELFHRRGDGFREQSAARSTSVNVGDALSIFPITSYLFDLSRDEIHILGTVFPGPMAVGADDAYRFQLSGKEGDLFHISVYARYDRPCLTGALVIRDGDFTVTKAALRPNMRPDHPALPSTSGFSFVIEQEFERVEPGIWLPSTTTVEIEGYPGVSGTIDQLRTSRPTRARLRTQARYVRYEANAPSVPYAFLTRETFSARPPSRTWQRLLEDQLNRLPSDITADDVNTPLPLSTYPQTLLFRLHENLPETRIPPAISADPLAQPTMISDEAIKMLIAGTTNIVVDSLISLEGPVPVQGKTTSELWFNRVDGLHLGMRWKGEELRGEHLGLYLKAGVATASREPAYAVGLRRALGTDAYASLLYRAGTRLRYSSSHYNLAVNSYGYLLNQDDYFDFYRSTDLRAEWGVRLDDESSMEVGLNRQRHRSLQKETDWNFCNIQRSGGRLDEWLCDEQDPESRANPPIWPGTLHSLDWKLDRKLSDLMARGHLEAEAAPSWLGSDFSFLRAAGWIEWQWQRADHPTLLPQSATYRLQAGGALGNLPPQRHGTIDGGLVAVAPFGTLRTLWDQPYEGRHYAAAFYEWRWGDGLLRPLQPVAWPLRWLAESIFGRRAWGMGWAAHGAHGRTWLPSLAFDARSTQGWHHEAGLSLTALKMINADITWRLDRSDRRVGLSFVHSF